MVWANATENSQKTWKTVPLWRARSTAHRDNIIFTTAASVASPAAPEARETFKEQNSSGLRIAAFLYFWRFWGVGSAGRIGCELVCLWVGLVVGFAVCIRCYSVLIPCVCVSVSRAPRSRLTPAVFLNR